MAKPELEFFDPLADGGPAWQPVATDATGKLSEVVLSRDAEGGKSRGYFASPRPRTPQPTAR